MSDQLFGSLKLVNVVLTAKLGACGSDISGSDSDEEGERPLPLPSKQQQQQQPYSFDLSRIALGIEEASVEYFPRKFAALKLCRPKPFSKALFFRSGKIVCVGNRSEEGGREAVRWFCERIAQTLEIRHSIIDISVQNIVATATLRDAKLRVRLDRAARLFPKNTQYEPELFPGCAFRFGECWKQVVNVFTSGKIVLTGVKNTNELKLLARNFLKLVGPRSSQLFMPLTA